MPGAWTRVIDGPKLPGPSVRRTTWQKGLIRHPITALGTALLLFGAGCTGDVSGSDNEGPAMTPERREPPGTPGIPGTGTPGTPGTPVPPGTGTANPGTPGAPGTTTPPTPTTTPPPASPPTSSCTTTPSVPATSLRRLTRFEYANSVKTLLGVDVGTEARRCRSTRSTNGFNNNAAVLTVSLLHAEKYVLISEAAAKKAVQNVATLTACDSAAKGEDACAAEFAKKLGRRAYRRPTTADDEAALLAALQSWQGRRQLRRGHRGHDPRGAAVAGLLVQTRAHSARAGDGSHGQARPVRDRDSPVVSLVVLGSGRRPARRRW